MILVIMERLEGFISQRADKEKLANIEGRVSGLYIPF